MPNPIDSPRGAAALRSLAFCGLLCVTPLEADSLRSKCGYSDTADERPATSSDCTFSQRQGYISITIDGGKTYEFSPFGDSPGNYRDDEGTAIYRLAGLGNQGQLFRLPDTFLFVYWNPDRWECDRAALSAAAGCEMNLGSISFTVQATDGSSLNQLRIKPEGLSVINDELQVELDGSAYRAELADLDSNGWPEIYVYVSSAGSGSYGSLVAYAVNDGKSVSGIYLPPLEQSTGIAAGYMGHDEFSVVENRLVRRFPIYRDEDTNAGATGGTRQLQYRLEAGEAGWQLLLDRVVQYP